MIFNTISFREEDGATMLLLAFPVGTLDWVHLRKWIPNFPFLDFLVTVKSSIQVISTNK